MPQRPTRSTDPTPVVVLHPSASFRRGVGGALAPNSLVLDEPADLAEWLAADTRRVVVVGDGSELSDIPAANGNLTVVALVPTLEVDAYRRALAGGAHGVAHVDADPDTIAHVIRGAVTGEVILPREIARGLAGRPPPAELRLSVEERGLLQRLSDGATVGQLADEFYLAERSVRRRLQNIYVQLRATGRAEALKRAGQLGLID